MVETFLKQSKRYLSMVKQFDKYRAYSEAVQSPDHDVRFLRRVYRELVGAEPIVMREDFCGTFALCCEWAKLGKETRAIGLDIDPEPIEYGKSHYLQRLSPSVQSRVKIVTQDVLTPLRARADITCALNFSYFAFHERSILLRYFSSVKRTLHKNGIFIVDIFGGPDYGTVYVDTKRLPNFVYTFEQEYFDPISNRTRFHIHFAPRNARKIKNAFTYDWRMWSIPEVKDLMKEAGFKDVVVYWEGTAKNGRGSGEFHRRSKGESCSIWVGYVVGVT
jgi:SAM-dependent methyltransferase